MNPPGLFACLASRASRATGHPVTFLIALSIVIIWGIIGPIVGYSASWQLVIHGTVIINFLMMFLIQNTQNREGLMMQIKLDELIRISEAHNTLLGLEGCSEDHLKQIKTHYEKLAQVAQEELGRGRENTSFTPPDVHGSGTRTGS